MKTSIHSVSISLRKIGSVIVLISIANILCFAKFPVDAEKEMRYTAKIRGAIKKLGVGREARVKVELRDQTKVIGFVSSANENTFTVTDENTGSATEVPYGQVKKAKGHNKVTGSDILAGIGGVWLVLILVICATHDCG